MSGMKPMSSMRSASSSTRISTWPRFAARWPTRSSRRPGRRDEDLDAGAQLLDLRDRGGRRRTRPPTSQRDVPAVGLDALGDLDGELARRRQDEAADGVPRRRERGVRLRSQSRSRIGRVNAAVLPVPVCAAASTSVPWRTRGIARSCTGVGSVYPSSVTVRNRTSDRPSSSKRKVGLRSPASGRMGSDPVVEISCPARRPPGCAGAAATAGSRGAYPTMVRWAHWERARSRRRAAPASRIQCMNMRTTSGRRCAKAVAAMRSRPWRRSAWSLPGCSRRWSSRSTAGSGSRSCRRTPRWISRRSPTALGGRKASMAAPADAERATGYVLGGISPLGTRRPLPTVLDASATDWPTIHVSAGRRGLEIELAAAGPGAAHRWGDGADRPARLSGPPSIRRPCAPVVDVASCRAWRGASVWRSTWRSRSR